VAVGRRLMEVLIIFFLLRKICVLKETPIKYE
jgi:hypothetical protein